DACKDVGPNGDIRISVSVKVPGRDGLRAVGRYRCRGRSAESPVTLSWEENKIGVGSRNEHIGLSVLVEIPDHNRYTAITGGGISLGRLERAIAIAQVQAHSALAWSDNWRASQSDHDIGLPVAIHVANRDCVCLTDTSTQQRTNTGSRERTMAITQKNDHRA